MFMTYSHIKGHSMVIIISLWWLPPDRTSNLVYTGKSEYLYNGVSLYSQAGHVARCVYICWRGHTGWYLTAIDEQGNERWEGGGERLKNIGKESRLSSVINEGIPALREGRGGQAGCVGERPGFIEKNHSVFGIKRKQTIIYID